MPIGLPLVIDAVFLPISTLRQCGHRPEAPLSIRFPGFVDFGLQLDLYSCSGTSGQFVVASPMGGIDNGSLLSACVCSSNGHPPECTNSFRPDGIRPVQ